MTTPSPKLGLALPAQSDPFVTADIKSNWEKIDAAPGSHICTSGTRPKWTAAQAGRKIIETNTGLEWMWNGAKFVRLYGIGLLKRNDGSFAIGERTTDFPTKSTDYIRVVSVTGVVIPDGLRPIRVDVSWYRSTGSDPHNFLGAIYRSNTDNAGPFMTHWYLGSTSPGGYATPGATFFAIERNGLPAGTYDFSFQIKATSGGTINVEADTSQPTTITVSEG